MRRKQISTDCVRDNLSYTEQKCFPLLILAAIYIFNEPAGIRYLGLKLQIETPFDVNTKLLVVSADHVIVPFGYLVLPYVRNIGLKKC